MKRGSTLFLKISVFIIGAPVLALGIYWLIWLPSNSVNPDYAYILYPIIIGLYVSMIPFYTALYKSFRLLQYIDKNKAFSTSSVVALKHIKFCSITVSIIYIAVLPFVFQVAELDDAPGLVLVGMVPIFASIVIAIFAAVLQRLLQEAINIKSENDLKV